LGSVQDKQDPFLWVLFEGGNYVINPNTHLWCDVDQFEYHWNAGRRLENEGKVAEAMRAYETAEALYKGDYLEDNLYEEWTILRREALKDIYLAILSRLADYTMQKSHYDSCILYCQKMLHNDRCREDAYERLMVCYSRLGQRSRSMSWYRICEKVIKTELDVEPAPQTTLIYRKLLSNEQL
jgi:DNA-binding SARP family transcriptional activator